jgi:hypothetical protein
MSASHFVDLGDVTELRIECSDKHETSVPVSQWITEGLIQKFFLDHSQHATGSPDGMREDFQTLSQLLSRLSADLPKITDIVKRRNFKIEFEIKVSDQ